MALREYYLHQWNWLVLHIRSPLWVQLCGDYGHSDPAEVRFKVRVSFKAGSWEAGDSPAMASEVSAWPRVPCRPREIAPLAATGLEAGAKRHLCMFPPEDVWLYRALG